MPIREPRVAIAGAGPVGMTAALLLAARGVRVDVIERRNGPSDEPKAISIDDEALRVYEQAGIIDKILPIIVPGLGTRYFDTDGNALFLARAAVPGALGYPFKNPFAQPDLERVLHGALESHPLIATHFAHEVVGVSQDPGSVYLDLTSEASARRIEADYVIGADGGRSTVRTELGIAMTGRSHDDVWLVVDTLEDFHTERYGMHFGIPSRPHVIVPGLNRRCRYEFRLFAGEGEAGVTPPFNLIRDLLRPYREISPGQVERAIAYRFNALNADRYSDGRVFIMGDAAHMMPPFAGQGLNSGIRDAANLCWKIAAVLAGELAHATLDTYDIERRPQAGAVVALSERLGRVVMATSERVARTRDVAVRDSLGTPAGRRFFEQMEYRPSTAFDRGLLVPGRGAGRALRQPRVFDVRGARMVPIDDVLGDGWVVIGVETSAADLAGARRVAESAQAMLVEAVLQGGMVDLDADIRIVVDYDGSLQRELESFIGLYLLVRPDHVIAAVWAPGDAQHVESIVAGWFVDDAGPQNRRRAEPGMPRPLIDR